MTGVLPEQIANGLNELTNHPGDWPPNAVKFRQLCLGQFLDEDGIDSSWQHNSHTYLDFNDPKHPDYRPKQIESDEYVSRRKKVASAELSKLKAMFPDLQPKEEYNSEMSIEEAEEELKKPMRERK